MADANTPFRPMPADWSEAFDALPMQRAPADAWMRVSAALPAHGMAGAAPHDRVSERTPRRRIAFAAAAALVLAAPMAWWLETVMRAPSDAPVAPSIAATPRPSQAAPRDPAPSIASTERDARAARSSSTPPTDEPEGGAVDRLITNVRTNDAPRRRIPSRVAMRALRDGDALPGMPSTPVAASNMDASASPGELLASSPSAPDLDALRQESARLEALVAYARDDRMASAPVAVISASLDDRLRLIDAALMQGGLDDDARSTLWSERVGALRELASLEGTQRWMAAHGTTMDAVARVD